MTAYVLTGNCNIDQLGTLSPSGSAAARTGGDTIDANGYVFTIDQDTRYGLTGSATTSFGNMSCSSTRGGSINVDGRYVRLIPFSSGSGTLPAMGSLVTQGGASGKIIGVWPTIATAPTISGTIPVSGFIKIKAWNGISFSAGALTLSGVTATATGPDVAGWIEVVGDENATATIPRLGSFSVTGEWFVAGTSTGTATDTYQLPTSGSAQAFAGCHVETSTPGVYAFYPCNGTPPGANAVGTDETRGQISWISTTGVLRLGHDGTNVNGYCPPAGRKIVIGNVVFVNCTTTARTVNAVPATYASSRYDFTTTGGGGINIDKAMLSWWVSLANASVINISNSAINDQLYITAVGASLTLTNMGVGASAALQQNAFLMSGCPTATITDCAWVASAHAVGIDTTNNLTLLRDRVYLPSSWAGSGNSYSFWNNNNFTIINPIFGAGPMDFNQCSNTTVKNIKFYARRGSAATTRGYKCFSLNAMCSNLLFDGIQDYGDSDWYPGSQILNITSTGNRDIELRNIGTFAAPLVGGMKEFVYIGASSYARNIKIRRVYVNDLNLGYADTGAKGNADIFIVNCGASYSDVVPKIPASQTHFRGNIGNPPNNVPASLAYGTHWSDWHTSATTGSFYIEMNEPSVGTASLIGLTGGAVFTGAGGVYMPIVGMSASFEMDYFAIGHTGFSSTVAAMTGGTASNYTYNYQLDKNNGSGFSAYFGSDFTTLAALTASLNGQTGIDAALGIKIKLRITTAVANTTAVTSFTINTTSTRATQAYQYPLDLATLTLTGLIPGTEIHAYLGTNPATVTELAGVESCSSEFVMEHAAGGQSGYLTLIKRGYKPMKIPLTYSPTNVTIPVFQDLDLGYNNPA
jgi:hypothetical protein